MESADDLRRIVAERDERNASGMVEEFDAVLSGAGVSWEACAAAVRDVMPWQVRVALDVFDARPDVLEDPEMVEAHEAYERLVAVIAQAWISGLAAGVVARRR